MGQRHRSHIKWFNNQSGFGFLHEVEGIEGEIAVFHRAITDRAPGEHIRLYEGDVLSFEVEDVGEGPRAANVRREGHVMATEEEWQALAAMMSGGKLVYLRHDKLYRVSGPSGRDVTTEVVSSLLEKRLVEAASSPNLYQLSAVGRRAYKEREND